MRGKELPNEVQTVCEKDMCTGCTACTVICPTDAVHIEKRIDAYNALINKEKCISCGSCFHVCQKNTPAELHPPIHWKQGWSNMPELRSTSASGGLASEIMTQFIKNNGIVCSCLFRDGKFNFICVDDPNKVPLFAGSKYVKSDPEQIFLEVKKALQNKKRVLFLGLPCQVAGLKKFISRPLQQNLYTVDLICHGTPSVELLQRYLKEHHVELDSLADIRFRKKNFFKLYRDFEAIAMEGIVDRYMISFLKCLNYTPNCYSCDYARFERCSDLSLGDSWGSSLPKEEIAKGISLILCQNEKGQELLKMCNATLFDVDIDNAVKHNKQLRGPAVNVKRDAFFAHLHKGLPYDRAMFKVYPKTFIKQDIKTILLRINNLWGGVQATSNIRYLHKENLNINIPSADTIRTHSLVQMYSAA